MASIKNNFLKKSMDKNLERRRVKVDYTEYKTKLKEARKKILAEIDKSIELHDADQTFKWLTTLNKIEEQIDRS